MTTRFSGVNGVNIAYSVQGKGPPLVLVMGYRLNSTAWPATFIAQLAQRFTVITLDNRGTGRSDKPVTGYAIANMARRQSRDIELAHAVLKRRRRLVHLVAEFFRHQVPDKLPRLRHVLDGVLPGDGRKADDRWIVPSANAGPRCICG
jgi:pimeloyl-ACP methyl ester carboxylesterase